MENYLKIKEKGNFAIIKREGEKEEKAYSIAYRGILITGGFSQEKAEKLMKETDEWAMMMLHATVIESVFAIEKFKPWEKQ